jgi:two-component system NtrC family sensor kinase
MTEIGGVAHSALQASPSRDAPTAAYDRPDTLSAAWNDPADEPPRRLAWFRGAARISAVVVLGFGLVLPIGGFAPLDHLALGLPGSRTSGLILGLGLTLAALALLHMRAGLSGNRLWRARGLALAASILGAVCLAGWIGPAGAELRAWLARQFPQAGANPARGPLPFSTALCLTLSGLAVLELTARRDRHILAGQALSLAVMLVALLALVGHAFHAHELYELGGAGGMPPATAIAFALLALGTLIAVPERGLMAVISGDGPGCVVARRLIPACLILPVVIGCGLFVAAESGRVAPATSLAASVLATILVLLTLIWTNAVLIERADAHRHRAVEELRHSEIFYHTLVESLPQNILRKDATGRFTFANRRFCETVGRPLEQIINKTDADLFPQALAAKYRADDLRVMAERATFETTEEHVTPDGQVHYVHVIKSPLFDARGVPIGVQGIFWDVTAERLAERRMREQYEQLQVMAMSERNAHEELKRAQAQMVQTAKLAGLGQMVAGVAHEINNPLAFVINNIVVMRRDLGGIDEVLTAYRAADAALAATAPESLACVRAAWEENDLDYVRDNLPGLLDRTREGLARIQGIVKDLRVFARMDEDQYADAHLNEGIISTIHIVQGTAKVREVGIDVDLGDLPTTNCQPAKINQVIMNLVSNAVEACESGGHVVVRSRADGRHVIIEVEDDGCGIDPRIRERIFDPFFTTKPIGVGTGLGLSISYGIVQEHGGMIDVDSEPGRGARFVVRLPIRGRDDVRHAHDATRAMLASVAPSSEEAP